ncbi:Middle sporulation-specific mitogen-activated protein kinase [Komagataella phaffii CBS 7435]|uniref:Middle sporulation-specific mitogen-activated protein kinase (MAPK) required for production of the o n=2 Tax=Komagataella phaffii TaxID=460519 RepID=C4R3D2_KOMPG|nr:Middle sporulation-specific mitogen-activated protein kinase (MAPK) required for production of the o [Komagataella phaffii GS115]AOA63642.1 GQ67_03051T0 [Komagataella phaffii]CAH2450315.1 Middle sporulation-specific mitogen-activated protein kinase [Komagataella phaffii CBS 7435]AOA69264.1 GQ68_03036T0 [Komagataella phaffii GS115]CAY69967.1 Middle sporulation-specific mitogen-activated protein kinase (MAPK) required for production of the o [Komagataella phaffii GS115]CCA40145.1 Middle sporu
MISSQKPIGNKKADIEVAVKKEYSVYSKANFYLNSRYQVQQVLGKGSYGVVCSVLDLKSENPVPLAVKKVSNIFTREVLLRRAIRELKLMKFFRGHRNIINLVNLDIVYIKPYDGLYCFQELVDYDLARVIHSNVQFSEFHIQSFLYQILCGVKYIHSADVIHRDLKPGNILVTVLGNLKICDFGLARGINHQFMQGSSRPRDNAITNYVATRWYRAPELIFSRKEYGKAVDMWAVGCIFGELYGRKPLFIGDSQMSQIAEIVKVLGSPSKEVIMAYGSHLAWDYFQPPKPQYRPLKWAHVYPYASGSALDLLSSLVCWEAKRRLDVEAALSHEFLSAVRNKSQEPKCKSIFDFRWEKENTSLEDLKILLHEEVTQFKNERENNSQPN